MSGRAGRDVPLVPGGRRVLGHALEFRRDPLALLQRAREHGGVVRIRFGPFPIYWPHFYHNRVHWNRIPWLLRF